MLNRNQPDNSSNVNVVCFDDLVPKNHLVRKIKRVIDFSFIYDIVEDLYSDSGRPSIDPVILFKIVFIQYLFNIRSMRRTIEEIEVNFAYKWFLGFDVNDEVPHFSTFSKNYYRRFKDSTVFEEIFNGILAQVIKYNLIKSDNIFIDSTHIKAYANKHKIREEIINESTTKYVSALQDEINEERINDNKTPINFTKEKKVIKSLNDPDCGMFHKGEKERQLAYSAQVVCDDNSWILTSQTFPANLHDGVASQETILNYLDSNKDVKVAVMDAGYDNPVLLHQIFMRNVLPLIPYRRPKGKKSASDGDGLFPKYHFKFIDIYDYYICPNMKILPYRGIGSQGYRLYRSSKKDCDNCTIKHKCTNQNYKLITRHPYEYVQDETKTLRLSPLGKELYPKRKFTIERVFAQTKMNHSLGVTFLRGLKANNDRNLVVFASHNMKKLALLFS